MGTRGVYGFRKNGKDKITYNHWDSYPDGLGKDVVRFCKTTSIEEMNEIYDRIELVNKNIKPTEEQKMYCVKYYNANVSTQSEDDWYCLLREAQGNLMAYKDGLKYMIDSGDFIKDSLFCEYGYVINLDTNCLEFWIGFQKKPTDWNRYGTDDDRGYYPCKMVSYYNLASINEKETSEYIANMNRYEEG